MCMLNLCIGLVKFGVFCFLGFLLHLFLRFYWRCYVSVRVNAATGLVKFICFGVGAVFVEGFSCNVVPELGEISEVNILLGKMLR